MKSYSGLQFQEIGVISEINAIIAVNKVSGERVRGIRFVVGNSELMVKCGNGVFDALNTVRDTSVLVYAALEANSTYWAAFNSCVSLLMEGDVNFSSDELQGF